MVAFVAFYYLAMMIMLNMELFAVFGEQFLPEKLLMSVCQWMSDPDKPIIIRDNNRGTLLQRPEIYNESVESAEERSRVDIRLNVL